MSNAARIIVLLPWIAGGAMGGTDAAPAKRVVRGSVIDRSDGYPAGGGPIPRAPVRLVRLAEKKEPQVVATAVSDENGVFRLETTSYGSFDLVISPKGWHSVTIHFEMSAEEREKDVGTVQIANVDCSVAMCDSVEVYQRVVRGSVIDPTGGPIPKAPVCLVYLGDKKGPEVAAATVSDEKGVFRLVTTFYGSYDLLTSPRGWQAVTIHFEVSAEELEKDVGTVRITKADGSAPGTLCGTLGLHP